MRKTIFSTQQEEATKDVAVAEIFLKALRKTARFFASINLIRITCIEVKMSLCPNITPHRGL
jgi:hypothetical protein